jgi:KTSC domain
VAVQSKPLRSTAIAEASYDDETRTMEVEFTNGRSYTHVGVPQEVYDGLVSAGSPGAYYNSAIKGRY